MNNEKYNQIIDEAYENYCMSYKDGHEFYEDEFVKRSFYREEFINKCKTNSEFSEKWGLKIEERELNMGERFELFKNQNNGSHPEDIEMMDDYNIPTKLITITYNNETIEVYE
jgi:hypothetical protein